jgi:hypothetical protein
MRIVIIDEDDLDEPPKAHEWLLAALVFMAVRDAWIAQYREDHP